MIYVQRGKEPASLRTEKVKNEIDKLQKRFEDKSMQSRMTFNMSVLRDLKSDLLEMFQGKCAYCESKVQVSNISEIEHFRPKSGAQGFGGEYASDHYWWLAFSWDNLLISCQVCNRKKRNFFPLKNENKRCEILAQGSELLKEGALLIDPCHDKPEEHFSYMDRGKIVALTEKGIATIKLLALNRKELVQSRRKAGRNFMARLKSLSVNTKYHMALEKSEPLEFIRSLNSKNPTQEYVGMLRHIFRNWLADNKDVWNSFRDIKISFDEKIRPDNISKKEMDKVKAVTQQFDELKLLSISSVEISNFKSIEKLTLNLAPYGPNNNQESWLLVLGDNGIGKSSILQAISLCLVGQEQIDKLDLNVMHYLRRGAEKGKVIIKNTGDNKPITLNLDKKGFKSSIKSPSTFVMAYGSTRLLPKGNIVPEQDKMKYANVKNLFDYSCSLENPQEWLKEISPDEFHNRVAPALLDLLILKDQDRLSFEKGELYITRRGETQALNQMSDGFRSVAGIAMDIMRTLSSDKAAYHDSSGIVIIDEIGSHLHPRWKVKIVGALKLAFPRLQFVVTSHEPLCLRGLEKGEVGVLVLDSTNKVQILDSELLPDHTMMSLEQLLTSDLFGLINVMDEKAEITYDEYYALLSKKVKSQDDLDRISVLSHEILDKELIGSTPAIQAHFELVNENYAKKLIKDGFKSTEVLKDETKKEASNFIDKKKLNWL